MKLNNTYSSNNKKFLTNIDAYIRYNIKTEKYLYWVISFIQRTLGEVQ